MKPTLPIALGLGAIALAASAGLGAAMPLDVPDAPDAQGLALRASDFPPSAQRMSEKVNRSASLPGGIGQAYATTFQFKVSGRTLAVGTIVITAPSVAVARTVYAAAVADARRSAVGTLRLSALGNEQSAALHGRPALDEASAAIWVRKGAVVWQVQTTSVRNPFGFSKAEALATLTTYARKQERRVGAG